MTIISLAMHDGDWHLQETHFGLFNLLVGISGVGKTKILEAIRIIRRTGIKDSSRASGCSWVAKFNIGDHQYSWEAELSSDTGRSPIFTSRPDETDRDLPVFEREIIHLDSSELVA
ncbi:MAG: hypothetical protein HQL63_02940 [Magnetococcales bacterium]|nr:hypothetical protein [Magnetococcales bacterium]